MLINTREEGTRKERTMKPVYRQKSSYLKKNKKKEEVK